MSAASNGTIVKEKKKSYVSRLLNSWMVGIFNTYFHWGLKT